MNPTMADAQSGPACRVILAGTIAKGLAKEVQDGLGSVGVKPHLVGFLANDDPAAKMYADWTQRTCLDK